MTKDTRQFLSMTALALIGLGLVVTETHRHIIAWAWPFATAFFDSYIAF